MNIDPIHHDKLLELRTMKDFAAICQFLHMFHPAFALDDFETEVHATHHTSLPRQLNVKSLLFYLAFSLSFPLTLAVEANKAYAKKGPASSTMPFGICDFMRSTAFYLRNADSHSKTFFCFARYSHGHQALIILV